MAERSPTARRAALGAVLALVAATAWAQEAVPQQSGATVPPGALIAPGDSPALTVLFSGNVVGYIDPCG
jgi:hypothetical protein